MYSCIMIFETISFIKRVAYILYFINIIVSDNMKGKSIHAMLHWEQLFFIGGGILHIIEKLKKIQFWILSSSKKG